MNATEGDDMRPEYDFDFSKAKRGKYHKQYLAAVNIVKLDDDVAQGFPDARAVNDALRGLLELAKRVPRSRRNTASG